MYRASAGIHVDPWQHAQHGKKLAFQDDGRAKIITLMAHFWRMICIKNWHEEFLLGRWFDNWRRQDGCH